MNSQTPTTASPVSAPAGSKLAQLAAMTTIVADTGDIEAVRRLAPIDCTTNPTLILKAVENPAYAHIVEEAVRWGASQGGTPGGRVEAVCDRLAVAFGTELAASCRAGSRPRSTPIFL